MKTPKRFLLQTKVFIGIFDNDFYSKDQPERKFMKRSLVLCFGLLLVFSLCQSILAQRPHIEFKEEIAELGELQEGEIVEHIFLFSNTGDAPLQIFDTFAD
jgi:hypothetical protein